MAFWDDSYWTREESVLTYRYPIEDGSPDELVRKGFKIPWSAPNKAVDRLGPFAIDKSPESHKGPFACAIDFLVPLDTRVYAAADGIVRKVVNHHTQGGPSQEFAPYMNYVTIEHADGESSQYGHLAPRYSEFVRLGKRVWAGTPIGKVGLTGWTDRPHLHFIVFRSDSRPTHGTHHHSMEDLDGIDRMAREWPSSKFPFKSLRPRFG
ncbi:MAG TPA: M23 family metallopeptidase [Candidatus Paceibacterota bacterium]